MGKTVIISIETHKRKEALDITKTIKDSIGGLKSGVVIVYVPHTTAGVIINEAYDNDVAEDIMEKLEELVPYSKNYKHLEGNSDAHIQSSMVGSSVSIIVENSKLMLGRWQGVFFMEFDGPRKREIYIKIIEG